MTSHLNFWTNLARLFRLFRLALLVVPGVLWTPDAVPAQVEAVRFETTQQESLYTNLIGELRCLVCANQSLSDSNSDLAKDLRGKVRSMVGRGQGRDEIVDYLVTRYGEYVLYRPRFSPANFFLWLAPFAAALAGLGFVVVMASRKARRRPAPYSAAQLQKAASLLEDGDDDEDKDG